MLRELGNTMLKVISHFFPSPTLFKIILDSFVLWVAVLLAVLFNASGAEAIDWRIVVPSGLFFALSMILLNGTLGLYRSGAGDRPVQVLAKVLFSFLISLPVAFAIFRVLPWTEFTTQAVEVSAVLLIAGVLFVRGWSGRGQASPLLARRVMVIGTGQEAATVEQDLIHMGRRGLTIVGFLPANGDEFSKIEGRRIIHSTAPLTQIVRDHRVDEIIVAVRERRGGVLPLRELLDCKLSGVKIHDLSTFFERVRGQVRIDSLKASWLIYGDGFRQDWARTCIKRFFDVFVALILLVLALPVMVVTAILILLEDGAPVFYRQERVGLGGKTFKVIKFRSMRTDAEKDGKPRWATSGDDRVTRVGRFIRRTRIDELPQFVNVLMGEMSLVGPRPERPYFVDQLTREIPFYAVRHCVKPGVTGWAQVRYQYGSSVDDAIEKLQYDLYYVKNHTLVLDTLVLFETVRVVLTGEGAH
jgi:sugar transferase (PEP-CTERM system associated)